MDTYPGCRLVPIESRVCVTLARSLPRLHGQALQGAGWTALRTQKLYYSQEQQRYQFNGNSRKNGLVRGRISGDFG